MTEKSFKKWEEDYLSKNLVESVRTLQEEKVENHNIRYIQCRYSTLKEIHYFVVLNNQVVLYDKNRRIAKNTYSYLLQSLHILFQSI